MEKITSKNNTLIKDTKKLLTSSRARKQSSLFVLEGARLCFDVLNSVYEVKTFFITEDEYKRYKEKADMLIARAEKAYFISNDVSDKLADTETSQGVFAVCTMKNEENSISGKKIIALDRVQDPANTGAILRSAEALGIDTVILYSSSDIYSPKTLRASMGSVLRINLVVSENLEQTLLSLKNGYKIYATVPDENAESICTISFSEPCICVIGNEANGVSDKVKNISDCLVTIPMKGNAESLNASVASAITMWEMLR